MSSNGVGLVVVDKLVVLMERSTALLGSLRLVAHPAFPSLCEGEEEGKMKRSTGRPFGEDGAGRETNQGDRTLAWTVRPRVAASLAPSPGVEAPACMGADLKSAWNKLKGN